MEFMSRIYKIKTVKYILLLSDDRVFAVYKQLSMKIIPKIILVSVSEIGSF